MTAGVCYSIAERPGIVPGFIIGYAANQSKAGFLGGLLMAFVIGYFIQWMKTWKLPKWMVGLMPVMIIPCLLYTSRSRNRSVPPDTVSNHERSSYRTARC